MPDPQKNVATLGRVQLQGNEVPAYNKVMAVLQSEAELASMATAVKED